MKFLTLEQLGQFLAPALEPAIFETPKQKISEKKPRGGKRDNIPWPREYHKRLHATAEIVRRWEHRMGYVETWKPWTPGPTWVRVNEAGLRNLNLIWNEIFFPQRKKLTPNGHISQVNQRCLALAQGKDQAPVHEWISERKIYIDQCRQEGFDTTRTHRPDGVMLLKADGTFPFKGDEEIPLKIGQHIAIEVELSQKGAERLGNGILPALLRAYDQTWYYCGNQKVYDKVVRARRDYLDTNEDRKRIRILLLDEKIEEEEDDDS
jgi:hypothetical protein